MLFIKPFIMSGSSGAEINRSFFIYEVFTAERVEYGLICKLSIDEFFSKKVLLHETVDSEKINSLVDEFKKTYFQKKPIMLLYQNSRKTYCPIKKSVARSKIISSFNVNEKERHAIYQLDDVEDIELILKAFLVVNEVYVADGHHRITAISKLTFANNEKNHFLSVLFPCHAVNVKGLSLKSVINFSRSGKRVSAKSTYFTPRILENFVCTDIR